MKIQVLYFASLAEHVGLRNEEIETAAADTGALIAELKRRGDLWKTAFDNRIRIAVNQQVVKADHVIADGDEIAFFPPVTGG